jgi:hypothetical protein
MKKQAGKYMGESNFPMQPHSGYGNMGRSSMMFGLQPGMNFGQAAAAGQQNPNQAKNLHMPSFNAATPEGIMAAAQKVAEYSFGSSRIPVGKFYSFGSMQVRILRQR